MLNALYSPDKKKKNHPRNGYNCRRGWFLMYAVDIMVIRREWELKLLEKKDSLTPNGNIHHFLEAITPHLGQALDSVNVDYTGLESTF